MKQLTLYMQASAEGDVLDCLRSNPDVTGFTLVPCQGHSSEHVGGKEEAAIDLVVGFVPRIRIEVILEDDRVESVLTGLKACLESSASQGMWTLTPVLEWGSL